MPLFTGTQRAPRSGCSASPRAANSKVAKPQISCWGPVPLSAGTEGGQRRPGRRGNTGEGGEGQSTHAHDWFSYLEPAISCCTVWPLPPQCRPDTSPSLPGAAFFLPTTTSPQLQHRNDSRRRRNDPAQPTSLPVDLQNSCCNLSPPKVLESGC